MIKAILLYFQFFTVIPLPVAVDQPHRRFVEGMGWFGLAAFLYSSLVAFVYGALALVFSSSLSLTLCLLFDVVVTGGFHYDGLADTADGLGSGQRPDRILAIMKDSRLGSHGVLALIFYVLIFILGGSQTLSLVSFHSQRMALVLGTFLAGRGAMSFAFIRHRSPGRASAGLGEWLEGIPTPNIIISQVTIVLALAILASWPAVWVYSLILILVVAYKKYLQAKLGGLTGDSLGAICLLAQGIFILLMGLAIG